MIAVSVFPSPAADAGHCADLFLILSQAMMTGTITAKTSRNAARFSGVILSM